MQRDTMSRGYELLPSGIAIESESIAEEQIKELFTKINLPRQFWDYELEHFDLRNDSHSKSLSAKDRKQKALAYELTKKYTDNIEEVLAGGVISMPSSKGNEVESNSIVFRGLEGSGKTLLSAVILKSALEFSHSVYYLPWPVLYDSLSSFNNVESIQMAEYIFNYCDLIVIDGATEYAYMDNNYFKMKLEVLFSKRLSKNKPIIWTMNLTKEAMKEMFGPSVLSFIKNSFLITLPQGAGTDDFGRELGEVEDE